LAALPLLVVVGVKVLMTLVILPRLDVSFLAKEEFGATSLSAVAGIWSVVTALMAAIVTVIAINWLRLPSLRETMDSGANASVLPVLSVASLVGFGAVVAAVPAFAIVRNWVLSIEGGPLVSLAIATNLLAALTGSASGGLTIALEALGGTYMRLAADHGIDPALLGIAVLSAGTLDSLPQNGAVVPLLAVCGATHRESYFDIVMAGIVGPIMALAEVIVLGSLCSHLVRRTPPRSAGMPGSEPPLGRAPACLAGFSSISPGRPRIGPSSRVSRPGNSVDERPAAGGWIHLAIAVVTPSKVVGASMQCTPADCAHID
jgi:H+/gluconate symporter-like permease